MKSPLPNWLSYSPATRIFSGVPLSTDKSVFLVSVLAYGSQSQDTAHDVFRVSVRKEDPRSRAIKPMCSKETLTLNIYLDQNLDNIKPLQRSTSIRNLAGFLGLNIVSTKLCNTLNYFTRQRPEDN